MDAIFPWPYRGWLRRHLLLTLGICLAIAVVATALGLLLWVRSYGAVAVGGYGPGRGVARMIDASDSSSFGTPSRFALVHPGTFEYMYEVSVYGRWPVTVESVEPRFENGVGQRISFVRLRREWPDEQPAVGGKMRIERNGDRQIHVTLRASCEGLPPHTFAVARTVAVHYRYLRFFSRTKVLPAGDGMVLGCP